MLRSPLDKPIISWEEFDRLFQEAFSGPKSGDSSKNFSQQQTLSRPSSPPPVRTASPEPFSDASVGSGGIDAHDAADALSDSFAGFISEEEIPMYTPLLFPTVRRKTSSESVRSDDKMSQSMTSNFSMASSVTFPKRPRLMSNQISSRRTVSSAGTGPRLKRQNTATKSRMQVQTSTDGTITTATIDVPDIIKESLNVDYYQDHLNVTWRTATITEKVLKDSMIRERKEKRYTQTIIVPEGTKFDNVKATLKSRTLTVSFPTNPKVPGTNKS